MSLDSVLVVPSNRLTRNDKKLWEPKVPRRLRLRPEAKA